MRTFNAHCVEYLFIYIGIKWYGSNNSLTRVLTMLVNHLLL